MSSMKRFHVSWLTGTGLLARSWEEVLVGVCWCEEVLVGYVGDDVYGNKPHPVPEWSVVVVPLLGRT